MYTGNGYVGRIVAKAAAEHLTPVTLELGGKSPCIIDDSANIDLAVTNLLTNKWNNAGQTCIAVDYILVSKRRKEELITAAKNYLKKWGAEGQTGARDNIGYGNIINERHFDRVMNILEKTTAGRVLTGGVPTADRHARHIDVTLIDEPALSDEVMREEIFGPLLPVIAIENMEEAVDII